MKIDHWFDVTCCECGRSRSSDYSFGMADDIEYLRRVIKKEGWTEDAESRRPVCPECTRARRKDTKKARWTDSLSPSVYDRLCNCQSYKKDIVALTQAKWNYLKQKKNGADYGKADALAGVLDHLDSNSQFFELTRDEYDEILAQIH